MKAIVDAFGSNNAPLKILKGYETVVKSLDIDITLTGREDKIRQVTEKNQISLERIEIFDTSQASAAEDHASAIMKEEKDSSMAEGLRLVAEGKDGAFVSTGNSGALVVGATMIVKHIEGVKRVTFVPMVPGSEDFFMLIDGGANVNCRLEMLLQFGIMGSIYLGKIIGVKNPCVALANVGTEDHKGGELQHQAFAMLKGSKLSFIGSIETRDISNGDAGVVVANGSTGNIILRMFEGVVSMVMGKFKGVFTENPENKMATTLLLGDMTVLKKSMDYNECGDVPVTGALKPVFKVHGSAEAHTVESTLRLTKAYVEKNVTEGIKRAISDQEWYDISK